MSNYRVTKFNVISGNAPHMGTDYEYWRQLKHQAERILEEAQELMTACEDERMQDVLDGFLDVRYTNEYMEDLLQAGDVDTKKDWDAVCLNNDTKYTTSYTYATESKEHLEDKGEMCYIESVQYEGELYYTVKRNSDNKVQKLKFHTHPELEQYVPEEFR
jgi:TPP-dependent pyruvate/acetoin dehydrogenase alpha subunit